MLHFYFHLAPDTFDLPVNFFTDKLVALGARAEGTRKEGEMLARVYPGAGVQDEYVVIFKCFHHTYKKL